MARIRTIKPDFFTSDDICALSPFARLLYIGLWCEADREGRLVWAPRALKRRYLPDDNCDLEGVCDELTSRGLVVPYGDGLAFIPTFLEHQTPNPREVASKLPDPAKELTGANQDLHASNPEMNAQWGKEGKGREGNGKTRASTAHEIPDDFHPSGEDLEWAKKSRPDLRPKDIDRETERFKNHARANNRTAHSWSHNWRNWISKADLADATGPPASMRSAAWNG